MTDAEKTEIQKAFEPLGEADRALAEAQVICPVTEARLGSMGTPIKLEVAGRTVFICCEGCRDGMLANPNKYFNVLDDYQSDPIKPDSENKPTSNSPDHGYGELPQMQLPQMDLPKMEPPA